ncbi:MAG: hypothetical protein KJI72_04325 [Patescibacteria group bacterium]|nr:hypothetical protein [Patescibacteria group bacterium]
MAHRILFYPVGNGDTSQIILENGKRILFDFRHIKKTEEEEGPEINLKNRLSNELKDSNRSAFDVVAFTHSDKDHIENSTEFFELLHADKYQDDNRIRIDTLWVPASMILETATTDEQSSEFIIWRQEARFRLKEGKGIRVFSKPDRLKDWLKDNGLTIESRKHLITDAGQIVPDFTLEEDDVEFFCHSPFIKHVDEGEELRNEGALIFNIRFKKGLNKYNYLSIGDSEYSVLEDIVSITKSNNNTDRLAWDLFNIPHHCSYKALSDEKGEEITIPTPLVEELLLSGNDGAYLVSSSNSIKDDEESRQQIQPPHIQARKCYAKYLTKNNGCKLLVTMEESEESDPKPSEFCIDDEGITLAKGSISVAHIITSKPAPRAG